MWGSEDNLMILTIFPEVPGIKVMLANQVLLPAEPPPWTLAGDIFPLMWEAGP